ncbi:MAG: FAD-dependent oxidoreductase, partial [Gemmatimonadales bacterium]
IWAIIARMYAARRSGLKREMFGYVKGGYARVLDALNQRVAARGIQVCCGTPVSAVRQSGDGVLLELPDGTAAGFDRVVLTVPCGKVAAMVPDLAEAEKGRLRMVTYQGIVCASILLKRPLGGYYVTNITDTGLPFTAVIEMTALVDPATFGGQSLIYLPRYLSQDSEFWKLDDDEVRETFLKGLARMYPDFHPDQVVACRIARAREVLAIPTLNYSATLLPPVRTSIPHVFVVNSAQIANGTLNLNETVGLANGKAAELADLLRPVSSARPQAGVA